MRLLCLILLLACLPLNTASADTAARKFGRGLAAMTTGFLEIPGNIVKETERQGAVGVPIGLVKGVGLLVTRELVGVYEFVSAPFPAPAGFRPILQPEYPWGYFQ
ncbi:MAG: exosortase system-associated protein, TIGR04073 family [Methylococcales bacterium]|nr:exosortase system-associated protein, TIGR04073 family [Methylococcales bacterium]